MSLMGISNLREASFLDLCGGSVTLVRLYCAFLFFFSSRRRHTRFDCDWSSDVCSSDLLVFKQGMRRDGSPLLLYGYGAYEHSNDPMFDPARLSLLDRGFVFAIAHVRGGGEMGREWYEDGRLLHKRNTFDDFIACADHLVAAGYTMPAKLAIRGRSAGGLLIGAVLNQRPELFACAVAQVPFVDALTTMLDDKLPLTVNEYDECGNPAEPEFYSYIKSYSSYDNVRPTAYPSLLVMGGLNDPRVSYWEPAKWVARLRTLNRGDRPIVLKTQMGAGHMGPDRKSVV